MVDTPAAHSRTPESRHSRSRPLTRSPPRWAEHRGRTERRTSEIVVERVVERVALERVARGRELSGVDKDQLLLLGRTHARHVAGKGSMGRGDRGHDGLHGGPHGVGGDRQGGGTGADGVDRKQAFDDGSVGVVGVAQCWCQPGA
jgi:hypothetical protein